MKRVILFGLLLLLFSVKADAASVSVKDGNIYYVNDKGWAGQITSSGRDENPVISPKRDWVYFVRSFEGKMVGEKYYPPKGTKNTEGILKEELWRVKTNGQAAKMLFRSERGAIDGPDPHYVVASVENIQFSPSGDKIYFETPNWVTSAGLHVMNADGSHEKLLGGGNGTKIVLFSDWDTEKKFKNFSGYIVTSQHRYWWFGGSYDWWYLFTPDFKEVGPLGDDVPYFTEMGSLKYTDRSEAALKKSPSKYVRQ